MKIVVGPEYDDQVRAALGQALHDARARRVWHFWGVGGSQELEVWWYVVHWRLVRIQAETYVGLSLHGSAKTVEPLAADVRRFLDALRSPAGAGPAAT